MTSIEFKKIRDSAGFTQSDIAEKAGVSLRTVQNWEAGSTKIPHSAIIIMRGIAGYETKTQSNHEGHGVPILSVHTTGSVTTLFKDLDDEKPLFYIDSPDTKDCDYGVRVSGDSMYPLIRNGGYVACKSINNKEHILYGEVYHIITADYSTVKFIKAHPSKPDWIMLIPYNKEIEPTPLPKSEIIRLAQVRAIIQVI